VTTKKTETDTKLAILALEDSTRDFELISELLIDAGYSFTIKRVETEFDFTASLHSQTWDIILADFKLPGFDAFSALRIRNQICLDTPFICVSGSIGEESAIELLKSGAVDYVNKDRPDRLPFAIKRALNEARETAFCKQKDEALKDAYHRLRESQAATLNILEDLKAEVRVRQDKEIELLKITTAVEQAGEVIFITDFDGTIQYINPTFTAVTGYCREEILGQNPRILSSGRHDKAFYCNLWNTITGGRVWQGRIINKRKDGTFYTEESTISPVKDETGRVLNFVAVKRDISERERMEAKLVIALEEKTRLVSELFHRTNNNMQVIQALLQYRFSAHPELPLSQFVEDVSGQIHSMAQAQQALFRVANLSRIDLAEYLRSVVQLIHDRYSNQGGAVVVSLDVHPVPILLDSAVPLGLVATELVTNAFRHAFPAGRDDTSKREITVKCSNMESGEIEVVVADNGIGWSPPGGNSALMVGGLGLAIALVEQQLGGTIAFDGGTGTTCIVHFQDNQYKVRV